MIERCYLCVTLKSGANCNVCDPLNSQEKPKNSLKESIRRTRATFTFALDYQGQRAWGQLVVYIGTDLYVFGCGIPGSRPMLAGTDRVEEESEGDEVPRARADCFSFRYHL